MKSACPGCEGFEKDSSRGRDNGKFHSDFSAAFLATKNTRFALMELRHFLDKGEAKAIPLSAILTTE